MAMNVGGGGGVRSEINVTPLVDVVLVLLIIFMVITPLLQRGYDVKTPPKLDVDVPVVMPEDQLIVRIEADERTYINKTMVPGDRFAIELTKVLKNRGDKIVFFAAAGDLTYDRAMHFMDLCYGAGAVNLGIVFDDIAPVVGS